MCRTCSEGLHCHSTYRHVDSVVLDIHSHSTHSHSTLFFLIFIVTRLIVTLNLFLKLCHLIVDIRVRETVELFFTVIRPSLIALLIMRRRPDGKVKSRRFMFRRSAFDPKLLETYKVVSRLVVHPVASRDTLLH